MNHIIVIDQSRERLIRFCEHLVLRGDQHLLCLDALHPDSWLFTDHAFSKTPIYVVSWNDAYQVLLLEDDDNQQVFLLVPCSCSV